MIQRGDTPGVETPGGRIRVHTITRASVSMAVTFGILLAVTIYGVSMLSKDHVNVVEGTVVALQNLAKDVPGPRREAFHDSSGPL